MNFLFLISNVLLLFLGQIMFKVGLERIGGVSITDLWRAVLSPFIILGLILYVIATGLWFIVLSRVNLSIAYPFQSLAYVLGVIAAAVLFKENVLPNQWIGVIIIVIGVIVLSYK